MNNKKKLNAALVARSERGRLSVDFDDAITVREHSAALLDDDRDSREELVWEFDSFRWEWN